MSSGSSITWRSVLEDKQKELRSLSDVPGKSLDQEGLRLGIVSLCKKQRYRDRIKLENRYFFADRHIIHLARKVNKSAPSLQSNPPGIEGLESLICRLALATLQVSQIRRGLKYLTNPQRGCEQGASISLLVNLLAELNSTVPPHLGAEVGRFPDDDQVQRPLQELFIQFCDSYVGLLRILGERTFSMLIAFHIHHLKAQSTSDALQIQMMTLDKMNRSETSLRARKSPFRMQEPALTSRFATPPHAPPTAKIRSA